MSYIEYLKCNFIILRLYISSNTNLALGVVLGVLPDRTETEEFVNLHSKCTSIYPLA